LIENRTDGEREGISWTEEGEKFWPLRAQKGTKNRFRLRKKKELALHKGSSQSRENGKEMVLVVRFDRGEALPRETKNSVKIRQRLFKGKEANKEGSKREKEGIKGTRIPGRGIEGNVQGGKNAKSKEKKEKKRKSFI